MTWFQRFLGWRQRRVNANAVLAIPEPYSHDYVSVQNLNGQIRPYV